MCMGKQRPDSDSSAPQHRASAVDGHSKVLCCLRKGLAHFLVCKLYQSPVPCPQELLLAPALLEQLTCAPGSGELGRILTMPEGHQVDLQGYRDAVCSGQATARAQHFSDLATELRNQLDIAKIAQQVRPCLPVGQQTC